MAPPITLKGEVKMNDKMAWRIATLFGAGYWPMNPAFQECFRPFGLRPGKGAGTISSILTMLVVQIPFLLTGASWWWMLGLTVVSFMLGLRVVGAADRYILASEGEQRDHTGAFVRHDFNQNCYDELPGQLVAGLPVFWFVEQIQGPLIMGITLLINALIFFRIFDAKKPFGIRELEKRMGKGAFGVLWDDIAAGVYAWAPTFVVVVIVGQETHMNHFLACWCISWTAAFMLPPSAPVDPEMEE